MVLLGWGAGACIPDLLTGSGGGGAGASGSGAAAGSSASGSGASSGSSAGGTSGAGASGGASTAGGAGAGGSMTSTVILCETPLDCPDPGPCASRACEGNVCTVLPFEDGKSCGPTIFCLIQVCSSGLCVPTAAPEGTVTQPGSQANCLDTVCFGGAETQVPNYNYCPDPVPDNCRVPTCTELGECKSTPIQNLPQGTACLLNGVPGICDAAGNCITG